MNQQTIQQALAQVMPLAASTGLYSSLGTFQSSDPNDFPDGFYSGEYEDLAGLTDLKCIAAPEDTSYIQATEVKSLQDIMSSELLHVSFTTFYPTLDDGWRSGWRLRLKYFTLGGVLINTVDYDILGVGVDSQSQHSVCKVRLTSV